VELNGKIVRLFAGSNAAGGGRCGDATPVRAIKAHSSAEVLSPQDV
jgi:hypothetical protein